MANSQQLDIEIAHYDMEIKRMQNEREVLGAKRAEVAQAELSELVAQVIALGGSASMAPAQKKKAAAVPRSGPKKYRDPVTGAEWAGQGCRPAWIKDKDKEDFLNPAWSSAKAEKTSASHSASESNRTGAAIAAGDAVQPSSQITSSAAVEAAKEPAIDSAIQSEIEKIMPVSANPSIDWNANLAVLA